MPVSWNSVAARARRTSASARRMPADAAATVGFFSCARWIASANVTRTTGAGAVCVCVCADTAITERNAVMKSCAIVKTQHALHVTTPSQALDHHIQHGDEREVQERRGDHASGD